MYQGNTDFWGGKNPTLFPMVGNTFSKTYEINGKSYAMKNHGLERSLKMNIPAEIYESLKKEIEQIEAE